MSKNITSGIVLAAIGILAIFGYIISEKDLHLNISKTKFIIGKVVFARRITIEKRGYRWIKTKNYFWFQLDNTNQRFAVDRTGEGTSDLEEKIKPGDTLKVHYDESSADFNTKVFQILKKNTVIESYQAYQKREATNLGLILFIGILSIISSIFYMTNTNIVDFLVSFVEGRKKGSG